MAEKNEVYWQQIAYTNFPCHTYGHAVFCFCFVYFWLRNLNIARRKHSFGSVILIWSIYFSARPTVMIATEEEMISAKLPLEERDYCAHLKIKYLACRADVWPLAYKCHHEKHAVLNCSYEEWVNFNSTMTFSICMLFQSYWFQCLSHSNFSFIIRMKEFEREKRLMAREERLKSKLLA